MSENRENRESFSSGTTTADSKERELSINFSGLVLGFSSAVLHYLGEAKLEAKMPESGTQAPSSLGLAKHNIDILDILFEKTKGNLDADETKLLKDVLTDLRMKYVAAKQAAGPKSS